MRDCHRKDMGSRYVEVLNASPGDLTRGYMGRTNFKGPGAGAMNPFDPSKSFKFAPGGPQSTIIKLKGLPFEANEAMIIDWFKDLNIRPLQVVVMPTMGQAFVEFPTANEVARAVTKHRSYLGKRYVDVIRVSREEMMHNLTLAATQPNTAAALLALQNPALALMQPMFNYDPLQQQLMLQQQQHLLLQQHQQQLLLQQQQQVAAAAQQYQAAANSQQMAAYGLQMGQGMDAGGIRVKLKGIPYRATEQQLMDFLRGYEVIPGSIQFGMEANGKRSGEVSSCGIISRRGFYEPGR